MRTKQRCAPLPSRNEPKQDDIEQSGIGRSHRPDQVPTAIDPPQPEPPATGPGPNLEESTPTATKVETTPETKTPVSDLNANVLLAGFALIPISALLTGLAQEVFVLESDFGVFLLIWSGVSFWQIFTRFSGTGNRRKYAYGIIGLIYGIFGVFIMP